MSNLFDEMMEESSEKDKQISDLEAKLADKDEQIKRRIAVYEKQFIEQTNENYELKQQLAEKEEELEDWKDGTIVVKLWHLERKLVEKEKEIEDIKDHQKDLCLRCGGLTHIEYEQDKISFCIEQLEKVRNEIHGICFFTCDFKCDEIMLQKSDKIIDNQIEELKKEMSDG